MGRALGNALREGRANRVGKAWEEEAEQSVVSRRLRQQEGDEKQRMTERHYTYAAIKDVDDEGLAVSHGDLPDLRQRHHAAVRLHFDVVQHT